MASTLHLCVPYSRLPFEATNMRKRKAMVLHSIWLMVLPKFFASPTLNSRRLVASGGMTRHLHIMGLPTKSNDVRYQDRLRCRGSNTVQL